MRACRWIAGATAAAMMAACTTTESISGAALADLGGRGPSGRALVLEDPSGRRVRLDPASKVKLVLTDGRETDWVEARRLAVTSDGRVIDGKRQLSLDQVDYVEVENVDGVKTYFVALGAVAVAAALVAILVYAGHGDADGSDADGSDGSLSGDDQPRIATETTRPRYAPAGTAWFYSDPWLYPPQPTFVVPLNGPAPPAGAIEPSGGAPNKLFTDGAVRRSVFAPFMQTEFGYGFDERTGGGLSVGLGFAIANLFELSGGVRLSDLLGPQRLTMGYVRAGGNFPFEAGDVFGAPIALDVAFSEFGFAQMRVLWGFRWRVAGRLEFALLPANPQLNLLDDDLYWDFPSMLQVGYRF